MGQTGAVRRPASTREWVGRKKAPSFLIVGTLAGLLLIAIGIWFMTDPASLHLQTWAAVVLGVVFLLIGLTVAGLGKVFSQTTVRINGDAFWWALWPSQRYVRRYRWDTVASVALVDLKAMRTFGGWGYRFAPGKGTAVVLGGKEAIELTFKNGKKFTITVNDAATGVEYANAFVQHHLNPTSHVTPEIPSASGRAGGLGANADYTNNGIEGERVGHALKSV